MLNRPPKVGLSSSHLLTPDDTISGSDQLSDDSQLLVPAVLLFTLDYNDVSP